MVTPKKAAAASSQKPTAAAMKKAAKKKVAKKRVAKKTTAKAKKKTKRKVNAKKNLAPAKTKRGLTSNEIALTPGHPDLAALAAKVVDVGGTPIGAYREPLSGRAILMATLPREALSPTPFQRDLSPTHTKRLAQKIEEAGSFLDPLIVVWGEDERFWTPNGRHRLAAAKVLGLRQVTCLISPDDSLAYRILALNTEKAHNLKDKSLEVIRMVRALAASKKRAKEQDFADHFEQPEFITFGLCYEERGRFSGSAYSPFLKRVDRFSTKTLPKALSERQGYASRLMLIDDEVKRIVEALKAQGFQTPYLKNYVVARINPVRFIKQKRGDTIPVMPVGAALTKMAAKAKAFDLSKVKAGEVALVAAASGS